MRLTRLEFRGLTRFTHPEPIILDFESLGPGLIAYVGPNGSGKTTAIEAAAAACWRTFPSRPGSLYDFAHGRDAYIQADWQTPEGAVRVRLQIDAQRKTTEGYIFVEEIPPGAESGSWHPVTDGKAPEFRAKVAELFGSQELFLASVFAAQNKAGAFLSMTKGGRKALFVELLGLGALDALQEKAKGLRIHEAGGAEVARALAAEVSKASAEIPELELAIRDTSSLEEQEAALDEKAQERDSAKDRVREAERAAVHLEELRTARDEACAQVDQAAADLLAAQGEVHRAKTSHQERLEQIDRVDAAGRRGEAILKGDKAAEALGSRRTRLQEGLDKAPHLGDSLDALAALQEELQALQGITEEEARHLEAHLERKKVMEGLDRDYGDARQGLGRMREERKRKLEDLSAQAQLRGEVPCGSAERWGPETRQGEEPDVLDPIALAGTCPLLEAANAAHLAAEELKIVTSEPLEEIQSMALRLFQEAAVELEKLAPWGDGNRPDTEADWGQTGRDRVAMVDELREKEGSARNEVAAAKAVDGLKEELADCEKVEAQIAQDLEKDLTAAEDAMVADRTSREAAQARLDTDLDAAGRRIATVKTRKDEADTRHLKARDAYEATGRSGQSLDSLRGLVTAAQAELEGAQARLDGIKAQRTRSLARLEALKKGMEDAKEHGRKAEHHARESSEWALLEQACGRDGIQALEIDAISPEVSGIANELLSCHGPRFTVELITQRVKKGKGKLAGVAEDFDVRVYDAGRPRPVDHLSGGEKVVISEAIGMGIAIYNARKSGTRWETTWRDETAGALDPASAELYVGMLRRMRELGGFYQVHFVAHSPLVYEAADVQLRFEAGRVRLETSQEAAAA